MTMAVSVVRIAAQYAMFSVRNNVIVWHWDCWPTLELCRYLLLLGVTLSFPQSTVADIDVHATVDLDDDV